MEPIELKQTKQLMLDAYLFDAMGEAAFVVHSWEKEDGPVFVKEQAWEGVGPYAYNLVTFDSADSTYKMWYATYDPESRRYPTGYAESSDGLAWKRRPEMIPAGPGRVVVDPRANKGDYRFFSIGYHGPEGELPGRAVFQRTKDGLDWQPFEGNPWWQGPSDVIDVLWDSQRECFVSYHKLWRVTGTTVEGEAVKAYFAVFVQKKDEDNAILHLSGDELFPDIHAVSYDLVNKSSGKDDGGGAIVTNDIAMLRVIGRAESKDFIHWTDHEVIVEPLTDDPIDVQYYGMPVVEYEGLYLAFPRYFEGISGRMDVRFAYSRDGRLFQLTDPKLVLACGEPGSWDGGMVLGTPDILEIDGRLCMYYGGMDKDHTQRAGRVEKKAAIGRAWLRKDGFVSLTGGTAVTKLLLIRGNRLCINAEGTIAIRLLDAAGSVVGTAEWSGDSTAAALEWQSGGIVPEPSRLEFDLSQGRLYALWSE
ncbi:MAG: hypothetical protein J7639_15380 [Paenibacillaceae bacterium]|nr:hypothetical protein [Paenibacillaceae bacterium]